MRFLLFSLFSGILSGTSFVFPRLSFLAWWAFAPLIWVIYRSRRPFLYVYLAALIHHALALCWIMHVSRLGFCILIVVLSFYWVLFAWAARKIAGSTPGGILVIPGLWVLMEFIREQVPAWGFGWLNLSYTQYLHVFFIQPAALLGGKFISFVIMTVNTVIAYCFLERKVRIRRLVYAVLIIIVCFLYSFYAYRLYNGTHFLRTALIQPNIPQRLKWDPEADGYIISQLKHLAQNIPRDVLLIYPEAAWPSWPVDPSSLHESGLDVFVRDMHHEVLMGAILKEGNDFYNAVLLVGKEGATKGVYRKMRLVPFGEYVPARALLGSIGVLSAMGDMTPGTEQVVFPYRDERFSVLICFEDIFPLFVARCARQSSFLVNVTNDAWFKGEPQVHQHLAILVFRALENRRTFVRCANTGTSGYVDPLGRIISLKNEGRSVNVPARGIVEIPLYRGNTLYNRWGELFTGICAVVVGIGIITRRK